VKLIPLSQVSQSLHAGVTLPWGVRDGNGTLLLAKGHLVTDASALAALLERGVFVDAAEAATVARSAEKPKEEEDLNSRWMSMDSRLGMVLRTPEDQFFMERVGDAVSKIARMADGNIDLLIFLIMRHDHSRLANYGITHSLHAAALSSLLSKRLGWSESRRISAIGAALTMNLSMLELQGQLAIGGQRPTPKERAVIDVHPTESANLLRKAGLEDPEWLEAVEQHHEEVGGGGYPNKVQQPSEIARLVHVVDSFTAKHSPRAGRTPQPAQKAARDLYIQSMGDPLAGLLIKEFGIYPPGCYVKLTSGEMAIVTHRGATANAPIVAAITNKNGDQLALPMRRDTAVAANAILSTIPEKSVMVRVSVETLYGVPKR
jgi:HD-GYP domain-containing protein (c-di-GMP phosphodiesterase class II)